MSNNKPDAERVTDELSSRIACVERQIESEGIDYLGYESVKGFAMECFEIVQQLRARQEYPLYKVDGKSGDITRIDKPLDVEKVMKEIEKESWEDDQSQQDVVTILDVRTILETVLGGKE